MVFQRNKLFSRFPWLKGKKLPMIVSADYDGLICASFLHHYLNWKLVGYYDLNTIWISEDGIKEKQNLTDEIKDCIQKTINPKGVAVVIDAQHLCMQMRGVQKQHSSTTTSAFSGIFLKDEKTRSEFMNLIQ